MELSSGSGNFVENVPLIYNKGCGLGDGCPTRDPLPWPAPARQRSLCSGAFAHPSLATLLQCFAVIAIPEYEADDELYAVAILREKPRPQPPGVRHYFVGVTRSLGGGPKIPPQLLQTLEREQICGLFRGNVTKEPAREFLDCKQPTVLNRLYRTELLP